MRNILVFLLLYKFIFINIFSKNLNQNIISHLINKKIRKLETDYKEEIYDNSTDEIEEIEKNNIIIFNVTKNLILPKIYKTKYLFLLIGFDSYERRGKYISWFIYFRVSDIVIPLKVFFNTTFYFNSLNRYKDYMNKSIICYYDKQSKYLNLKYYCSFVLEEKNENKEIKKIEVDYNSFTFQNLSYEIILSPNANHSIYDIQKETNKLYEKFIKDNNNDLYILDDGKIKIDNKKRKLYIIDAKINENEFFNNNKTIEGNFIFKFKNELMGYSENNIPCEIKIYKDFIHTIECSLNGPILTDINKAVGYGNEENIKNKYIMLNINDNLLNFTGNNDNENNINIYQNYNIKNHIGLSGWTIGGITIVCIVLLLIMSICLLIVISNKSSKKRENNYIITSVNKLI